MTADPRLIARSAELKPMLLDYAQQRRFERDLRRVLREIHGRRPHLDEGAFINFLDRFVLQETLRDGQTVLEHFVADHPGLTAEERTLVLGWRNVIGAAASRAHS